LPLRASEVEIATRLLDEAPVIVITGVPAPVFGVSQCGVTPDAGLKVRLPVLPPAALIVTLAVRCWLIAMGFVPDRTVKGAFTTRLPTSVIPMPTSSPTSTDASIVTVWAAVPMTAMSPIPGAADPPHVALADHNPDPDEVRVAI
jgi:hypothetical protein